MTLGFFPTPYPDELLYSVCARYTAIVRYPSTEAINIELFGRRGIAAIIDLPSHLAYLTSQFPSGHQLTVNRLVEEHSLKPYYSPFMGVRRVHALRSAMEGNGGVIVHKVAGIVASNVNPPERLRFCPQCVKSDRSNYGECYWHRLHQVAGVTVCPQHSIFLEESTVRTRNRANSGVYVAAEQAVQTTFSRHLDPSDPHHQALLNLADDSRWLLSKGDLVLDCSSLREHFLKMLADKHLVSAGGKVRSRKLLELLKKRYPLELLRNLGCGFDARNAYNWLPFIIKDLKRERGHSTLKYLLVIRAAGHTAESFFAQTISPTKADADRPFGAGPFPCLNSVCKHYKKTVIEDCGIRSVWPHDKGLVGNFRCAHCGFEYLRRCDEKYENDPFRSEQTVRFGAVWEGMLKRMWRDLSLSVREIARRLGVDHKTAKCHATRLGLAFPRQGPSPKIMQADPDLQESLKLRRQRALSAPKQLARYRRRWLVAMANHPGATRTQLQKKILPLVYHKLMHLDREWLKAHMPPAREIVRPAKTLDWPSIDASLVEEIRSSSLRLKQISGRPKRITKQAIAREIDKVSLLDGKRYLDKLPLCHVTIAEVVEGRVDYCVRLIEWAAECFRQENVSLSRSGLVARASISSDLKSSPRVREAIDAALMRWRICMNSAAAIAA